MMRFTQRDDGDDAKGASYHCRRFTNDEALHQRPPPHISNEIQAEFKSTAVLCRVCPGSLRSSATRSHFRGLLSSQLRSAQLLTSRDLPGAACQTYIKIK